MVQRSPAQRKIDERAFPIRVLITVPARGFGQSYDEMQAWLRNELGPCAYAIHAGQRYPQSSAFYFRALDDARRFLDAFPRLELADGTRLASYSSPARAAGLG